ncbi:hypothetical protein R1flu_016129 [Riccia fluitans]|uniref:Uncharacterized protein n=1 Tax=Riccia fluitans TaxID=41844 RepID=A0ABD1YKY1_9MARC
MTPSGPSVRPSIRGPAIEVHSSSEDVTCNVRTSASSASSSLNRDNSAVRAASRDFKHKRACKWLNSSSRNLFFSLVTEENLNERGIFVDRNDIDDGFWGVIKSSLFIKSDKETEIANIIKFFQLNVLCQNMFLLQNMY